MGMFVNDGSCQDEAFIRDNVGGLHEDGLGWNPQGFYCGECSKRSCQGCMFEKYEEKNYFE